MREVFSRPRLAKTLSTIAGALVCVGMVVGALWGPLREWHRLGGHDWDQMEAHRYLLTKSVRRFGQFPFWNPYGCGGHPSWAGVESGTTIVSPFLPLYLLLPLAAALRIELVGTALLSAAGTWLFVRRLTGSVAVRVFVCAVYVINSRWAFQASVGHTWHLYYAWVPWALWAFDAACEQGSPLSSRWKMVVALAASFAMMVYTGAIYALPQTALLLGGIALFRSVRERNVEPLLLLGIAGPLGGALAAPKLLPALDMMRRYPRTVDSPEFLDLGPFVRILTEGTSALSQYPVHFSHWGLHEYAIYIGPAAATILVAAIYWAPATPRVRSLAWFGVLAMLLGLGSFHEKAPWPLLHNLPIFRSQHVPSRWMYPGLLLLGGVAAAAWERVRLRSRYPRLMEALAWGVALHTTVSIVSESESILHDTFSKAPPPVAERSDGFEQHAKVPPTLQYAVADWAPAALPAHIANTGVIECITFPGLNGFAPRDANGRILYLGARGSEEADYHGEAFLPAGVGSASITRWTPNAVTVEVKGARAGDVLVLNQNWDESWRANGAPTIEHAWTNGYRLVSADESVEFRYRPRTLTLGCCLAAAAIVLIAWVAWRERRRSRPKGAEATSG
ncbi:MAG: hypothetical protein HOO96_02265 [Polyangiaceae bacterium]|nr:hypothetical protein [Polyangiaceae bacterium]